jgi:hypothetical protein
VLSEGTDGSEVPTREKGLEMKTTPAAAALLLLLVGCTPTVTTTDPDDSTGGETVAEESCLTGEWDLDVANYREQSQEYLTTLGVPITDFTMSGTEVLSFSADGGLELASDITSGGTITVPGFTGPVSTATTSISSGNWSTAEDGSLTIENWTLIDNSVTSTAPEGVDLGGFSLTNASGITALCDETSLFLQGPDAPLGSYWTRR